jgi:acyl dehydratase
VNPERARAESPFGNTIAHGFLTLSLMSRLVRDAVVLPDDFKMGVNYGFNRLRFPAPVPAGSRIRARVTLNALKEFSDHVEITWGVTIEIENNAKPALVAEWLIRKYF